MARTRSLATRERDARAVELRRRGMTYQQISDQIGLAGPGKAHDAVRRGIRDSVREDTDEQTYVELERLDEALRTAYRIMMGRHVHVASNGAVVTTPGPDGKPVAVYDQALNLQAAMGIMRLSESRRKLLGLDAPTRSKVEVITEADIDAEWERLQRESDRIEAELRESDHARPGEI